MNEELVQSLVDLETRLAQATPGPEDAEDVTKYYNIRSVGQTRALLPQVDILSLVSAMSPGLRVEKFMVTSPSYLVTLSRTLQTTSKETIQAFLVWKTVQKYAEYITDDAVKPLKAFKNQLKGKNSQSAEERWRTCVKHVDKGLG